MVVIKILTESQIRKLVDKQVMIKTDFLINELNKERQARLEMERTIGNLFSVKRRYKK